MKRVVSLLPSATEAICAIEGGSSLLVGRSHECNWPHNITHLPILTGQRTSEEWTSAKAIDTQVSQMLKNNESLYTINESVLEDLKPDLILTQDICAVCAIDLPTVRRVAARMNPSPPVISLDPQGLDDVIEDIRVVGEALGMKEEANESAAKLRARIDKVVNEAALETNNHTQPRANVAFIEWPDPIYVGGHWTPQMIHLAGGAHPLNPSPDGGQGAGKSFPVSKEAFIESDPDIIVISPCGLKLPESQREAALLQEQEWSSNLRAFKEGNVWIVDGDAMFNRPGPRLVDALEWLFSIINDRPNSALDSFPSVRLPRQRVSLPVGSSSTQRERR